MRKKGYTIIKVEGAAFEDGRKASIFDTFAHSGYVPGNGDVASDEYHKYKEDVQLMLETKLDAYRFSISWSRLIPNGRGPVNAKGLEYYNNLINELISHGIQPHVTLMHFDLPQALEDEYGGFVNPRIVDDFTAYANVCFREFGDRVLHWTTVNQANIFVLGGYDTGFTPPNRCSYPFCVYNRTIGNSTAEPYIAAHHILLTHASVVRLYREKYQDKQHGFVGISLYAFNFMPLKNTTKDVMAAQRSYEFFIGWFMHPLIYGVYPDIMKRIAHTRLPDFTRSESELVKGSYDFVGLNYYTVHMTQDKSEYLQMKQRDYTSDMAAKWIYYNSRVYSDPLKGDPYLSTPWGLQGVLEYFKQVYNNPPIFILENGQQMRQNGSLNDLLRVEYLRDHIGGVLEAVRNGSNVKGYFVWSFIDAFELMYGYEISLGIYHVDFGDANLTRYPKLSQKWYAGFLKGKYVSANETRYQADNEVRFLQLDPGNVDGEVELI